MWQGLWVEWGGAVFFTEDPKLHNGSVFNGSAPVFNEAISKTDCT